MCKTKEKLRKALESLPDTLEETYERILCQIEKKDFECAHKILQWLAFSARPLRLDEMADVVGIEVTASPRFDPDRKLFQSSDIFKLCSSLVTTIYLPLEKNDPEDFQLWKPEEPEEPEEEINMEEYIVLSHFSVKEYLVSSSKKEGSALRFSISEIEANKLIAEGFLAYLLQLDKPDFSLESVIERDRDAILYGRMKNLFIRSFKPYTLARYAAESWAEHTRAAKDATDHSLLKSLVEELYTKAPNVHLNYIQSVHDAYNEDFIRPWIEVKRIDRAPDPLIDACEEGILHGVEALIIHEANVNAQGGKYGDALQAAAASHGEQLSMVELLIEKGAEVNTQGGQYGNVLQAASYMGSLDIVRLLIEEGAEVNAQGGEYENALQAASSYGHLNIVQLLVEKGAEVNAQGGLYGNALQAASSYGHLNIVQLLVEKGAEVNAQGGRYGNALQAASYGGSLNIVRLLIEKGAEVNAQSGGYGNALQAASFTGSLDIVRLLIENEANVNAQGGVWRNSLEAACTEGNRL